MAIGSSRGQAAQRVQNAQLLDEKVLDAIARTGIGVRDLLKVLLGGTDPNNIIQRLTTRGAVYPVRGALPQNRSYYLPKAEKPLGGVALQRRLAVAWFVQAPSRYRRVALLRPELERFFGPQTPPGQHVLQTGPADRPRVLLAYAPDTEQVAEGVLRVIERARTFPKVKAAIDAKDYGFAVLTPWKSALTTKLRSALVGHSVPGLSAMAKLEQPLSKGCYVHVEAVATPLSFHEAAQSLREEQSR